MWDLSQLVRIQKARNALRDGRLDEAFEIATDPELADDRRIQLLLEKLVPRFLERGKAHLEAGRTGEALADVERAQRAGGNRPEIAALRDAVLERMRKEKQVELRREEALRSIGRRIREGKIGEGARRLAGADLPESTARELERRIEERRRHAEAVLERMEQAVLDGDLDSGLACARELLGLAGAEEAVRSALLRLSRALLDAAREALERGELARARRLLEGCGNLELPGFDAAALREALQAAGEAAEALHARDWRRARIRLRRFLARVPEAEWAKAAAERLALLEEALEDVLAGPLGELATRLRPAGPEAARVTLPVPPHREPAPRPRAARSNPPGHAGTPRARAYHVWVDGGATYLVLEGTRFVIGRMGSSAEPDIALAADLESRHAEIEVRGGDCFLNAHGEVEVAGRRVSRALLNDGDVVVLGRRSRFTFRQPSKLSPAAVLELGPGLRLPGDVRRVVLAMGPLIASGDAGAHIRLPKAPGKVVLRLEWGRWRAKAPVPVAVAGRLASGEAEIPFGEPVEVGPAAFTITRAEELEP